MPVENPSAERPTAISARTLETLACPVCFGALSLSAAIGKIECQSCHRQYPLQDGIPVLIANRASH